MNLHMSLMPKDMFFLLHKELENGYGHVFIYICRHLLFLQLTRKLFKVWTFMYTSFLVPAWRMLCNRVRQCVDRILSNTPVGSDLEWITAHLRYWSPSSYRHLESLG